MYIHIYIYTYTQICRLDAAGVIGFFAAMTIVVDANGQRNPLPIRAMMGVVGKAARLRRRTRGWLLPGALTVLGVVIAVAAARRLTGPAMP